MAGIFLIMAGLLLSSIDVPAVVIAEYPSYTVLHNVDGLGEVIQDYVINNMIGKELRADIMSDVLGYVLIFIGVCFLLKYSMRFLRVFIPLLATTGLYLLMKYLPFLYEGKDLVVYGLAFSVLLVIIEIIMEYFLIYSIADVTSELPNRRDTVLMKFGWIGSALCRGILYCIILVGLSDVIINTYRVVQVAFMLFCLHRMFKCRHYLHVWDKEQYITMKKNAKDEKLSRAT